MNEINLGQSVPRREDPRFLTGRGRYSDDIALPGALWSVVLRSPHAHATILSLDAAEARAVPGVVAIYTEADLAADRIGDLPCKVTFRVPAPLNVPPRPALARGRVRHVGDSVAFVVAESRAAALDAMELIEVDYEALPAVVDPQDAMAAGAVALWPEAPGNISHHVNLGDSAATERAIAEAAHVVEVEIDNHRVVAAPIEPRAAIAEYDAGSDVMTLTLSGQGVHGIHGQLCEDIFAIAPERLVVRAPDVGGGFGMKNFLYPEWVLVLWAARRHGRPVRWLAERGEEFLAAAHGRDIRTRARLALDAEGNFLALQASLVANMGAYLSGNGPGMSTNSASTAFGGIYAIAHVHMESRGVFTNTAPLDAYRGAGKPEANFVIERLIDIAARRLGRDPVELRLRNAIRTFPHRSALGFEIDCGRFTHMIEVAVAAADRAGFEARRKRSAEAGRLRGMGLACFLETSRGAPGEGAEIRFAADGAIELRVGTESNGQGHETTYPRIAADRLGLPAVRFSYLQGDTSLIREGHGHGGARSMHMGGTALVMAIERALGKGKGVAARLLQAGEDEVDYAEGEFRVAGSDRRVGLDEVARAARESPGVGEDGAVGLDSFAHNDESRFTFPNGCHVAELEIDPETGALALLRYLAVDDYGRLLDPRITTGQVQGGLAQGIGQALWEAIAYQPETAQLLSASLMDYVLPRAADLPDLEVRFEPTPTGINPLGVKGSGQAGCIGASQTIMNAVLDALSGLGIEHLDMPATPQRIWRAIRAAERR